MTYTDKHIVETYSDLLAALSAESKTELIENLSRSLQPGKENKESDVYKSFGAFASEKSAEEIVADIKWGRRLGQKESKLTSNQYICPTKEKNLNWECD